MMVELGWTQPSMYECEGGHHHDDDTASLAHGDMASGSGSRVNEEAQLCGLAAGLSCEC